MKSSFRSKKMYLTLALMLTFFSFNLISAQTYEPENLTVVATAISDGTDITIRWVPSNYESWKWGNDHGYRLEKMRVDTGGTSTELLLLDSMLMPMPAAQWQSLKDTNDMAKVAYKMIFEDSLEGQYLAGEDFITIYEAKKARENLYLFCMIAANQSMDVAEAAGLAYIDDAATAGAKYVYYVTPNDAPASTDVSKGVCEIETDDAIVLPAPTGLRSYAGDRIATIGWESDPVIYNGYMIERSDDNGSTWQAVNNSLYMPAKSSENDSYTEYRDSLALNNTLYIYRVKGCSPFGITGPVSDTIHITGKPGPLKDAYPFVIDVDELTIGELTINWEFPMSLESEIQGFDVYRASKQEGKYKKRNSAMISVTARSFTDDSPLPANYYKIAAIDNNGHELYSVAKLAQPEDTTPPSPPANVSGESNLSGTVTLSWTKSPEEDVKGYRVFISNHAGGDFTQITSTWINDTIYHYGLNLNTLSEEVYFVVKAVDFRDNMSNPSPVCTVQRPDIIPPAPPSIDNVVAEAKKVHFEWALSSSDDVVEHEFQRKPNGAPGWKTLLVFDTSQQILSFSDSVASYLQYWDYRLLARDDAGLLSSSDIVKAKPGDDGIRFDILNLTGVLNDGGTKRIILEWDYVDDPDLTGFQIYRSFDGNPMQSYKFVSAEKAFLEAININSGNRFAFIDEDLDFSIPVQTTYSVTDVGSSTVVTGGTVTQNGNVTTVVPQNPNIPQNPQSTVTVNYWIMAKHFDGGFSPLTQVLSFQVN